MKYSTGQEMAHRTDGGTSAHYPGPGAAAQRFRDTCPAFSPTVDALHRVPKGICD
ncbi:MAG TPA: hypothetical protein VIQ05_13290 [Tardiphaga sp.]